MSYLITTSLYSSPHTDQSGYVDWEDLDDFLHANVSEGGVGIDDRLRQRYRGMGWGIDASYMKDCTVAPSDTSIRHF